MEPVVYAKGCLGAAWEDIKTSPGWVGRTLILGLIMCVPILNFVVAGYYLNWAREVPFGGKTPKPASYVSGKNFEMGFYAFVVSLVVGLVFGFVGGILGLIPFLGALINLALMLAATLGTIWYCGTYVREQLDNTIVLKETVGNENYLYVENQGHLLRLKCGADVDFNSITLESEHGDERSYRMDCRWNRRTYEGTVSSCEATGSIILGGMMDVQFEVERDRLFWYDEVNYTSEDYYPDPYSEPRGLLYLCNFRFWTGKWDMETGEWKDRETVLLVEDCLNAVVDDIDGDGHNEVVVRTRWPEKPYMVYDWCGDNQVKEIDQYWLDSVSPELQERLLTIPEESARAQARLGSHPPVIGETL